MRTNPATQRYAQAWIDPDVRTIVFAAANGIGKTYVTVALTGWTIWPETAPEWFRRGIAAKWTYPRSFRVISTVKEVEDVGSIQAAIKELWPRGRYRALRGRKSFDATYEIDNGWYGDVMTYEQKPDEFEGGQRGLTIFNEPPPEDIYKRSVARRRMGGMIVFPMTPLTEAAWIKDKLVDGGRPDVRTIFGDIEEACIEHSSNGHLKHGDIEAMVADYDPDEVEARTKGSFMHLSGRVWKTFNREQFVGAEDMPWYAQCPKFQIIDPAGRNKPFAVIWGQILPVPMHGIEIMDEWPRGGEAGGDFERMKDLAMSVDKYANLFRNVEYEIPMANRRAWTRILDRRFGNVGDLRTSMSLREHFEEWGQKNSYPLEYIDSYSIQDGEKSEIETGIQNVKNYLRIDPLSNVPMLRIHPRCVNTIRAMERWGRDPKTQKPNDDVWKNFADVVRYLCSANLQFESQIPQEEWNKITGPLWRIGG